MAPSDRWRRRECKLTGFCADAKLSLTLATTPSARGFGDRGTRRPQVAGFAIARPRANGRAAGRPHQAQPISCIACCARAFPFLPFEVGHKGDDLGFYHNASRAHIVFRVLSHSKHAALPAVATTFRFRLGMCLQIFIACFSSRCPTRQKEHFAHARSSAARPHEAKIIAHTQFAYGVTFACGFDSFESMFFGNPCVDSMFVLLRCEELLLRELCLPCQDSPRWSRLSASGGAFACPPPGRTLRGGVVRFSRVPTRALWLGSRYKRDAARVPCVSCFSLFAIGPHRSIHRL